MKSLELIKPYFIENRMVIFLGFACLILVDFLQLTIPRIIKWAIDDLTSFTATPASLCRLHGIYSGHRPDDRYFPLSVAPVSAGDLPQG